MASMNPVQAIREPARDVPVARECDVCVIGGSCTGVFAAVRAARLGARVTIIEKAGCFGGVATQALVNVWHSPRDTQFRQPIIGGLTIETMERLKSRHAVTEGPASPHYAWSFNPQELQIELDELIREAKVTPWLHTLFVAPLQADGRIKAVLIENKSGRSAIRAKVFIDATGDGDLVQRAGLDCHTAEHLQPATMCAVLAGWNTLGNTSFPELIREHGHEVNLPEGFAWGSDIPGSELYMLAGTRVYAANCADGEQLTRAMMEGRRQVRGILDLIRRYVPGQQVTLQGLPGLIGIRQTRQIHARYRLTGADVLSGRRFEDAIANGSYRVDVHHQDKPGITFKYLDGTQEYLRPGHAAKKSRWRAPTEKDPTFYQIPLRSLLPRGTVVNVIAAGRMLDADPEAFAAARVMVNLNQTGEAAGVTAVLALAQDGKVQEVPAAEVRKELARGGSVIL